MKHPSTLAVFEYWDRKRGSRPAPERAAINPSSMARAMSAPTKTRATYCGCQYCRSQYQTAIMFALLVVILVVRNAALARRRAYLR